MSDSTTTADEGLPFAKNPAGEDAPAIPPDALSEAKAAGSQVTPAEALSATPRTLLKLAWPIIVSRLTQSVIGVADAYMVAHLGATGRVNPYRFHPILSR